MDIGGLLLDGVGEDQVDQLDDRGVLGGALQRADIDILFLPDDLEVLHLQVAHDVGQRRALVIELVDGGLDRALGDHDDFDVVAGHELDVVDGEDVGRITHRYDERGAGPVHRNDLVFMGDFRGYDLHHRGIDLIVGKVYGGNAVLLGKK